MSDTLQAVEAIDHAPKIIGRGFLREWDADKLRHVIDKDASPRFLDGTASLPNLVRAVRYHHMPKSALLPQNIARSLAEVRDKGLWVPADSLLAAAELLRDKGLLPDVERDGGENLFVTVGITRLWANLNAVPAATAVFDATHCRIGTGDTSTAAAAGNTDLAAAVAAANRWFQILDGAPSASTNQTSRTATFPTGNGNYVWNEWGVDNGTASGATAATSPLLNRAVSALGTKTSAAAWAFTVTHSIS